MGKPAPTFWWDTANDGMCIVQSDYPGGERLAEFAFKGDANEVNADSAIIEAEKLIADFEAGRKTPNWRKK